eukprot:350868-Chlamydomonas_euryale.AAC.2
MGPSPPPSQTTHTPPHPLHQQHIMTCSGITGQHLMHALHVYTRGHTRMLHAAPAAGTRGRIAAALGPGAAQWKAAGVHVGDGGGVADQEIPAAALRSALEECALPCKA